jgi:ribosomal protein S18 acetylase RimI-like enzyme
VSEVSAIPMGVSITMRLLRHHEIELAARLVGRGMCNNPANMEVFRITDLAQRARALGRFFVPVLQGLYRRGFILGTFHSNELVGVCGMARPDFCQPSLFEKMRVLPAALIGNSASTPLRLSEWVGEWSSRDPTEPHWHLGPVAVEPRHQHQGIGSAMLDAFCRIVDGFQSLAYLETDKEENVRLYCRFGFRVVDSAEVLGVPNWFMSRPSRVNTMSKSNDESLRNPFEVAAESNTAETSFENPGIHTS